MSLPRWDCVRTLLGMLLREQGRERAETIMSVVLLFGAGVGVAALPADLLIPKDERGPSYSCTSRPANPPRVAVVGEQPEWLRWPEALVSPEQADVLLRVDGIQVDVVPLQDEARLGAVTPCLKLLAQQERQRQLDQLGVLEAGDRMLIVEATGDVAPEHRWEPTPSRATVAGAVGMIALSACVSAAARARAAGFRETLAAGPVRPSEWTAALLLFSLVSAVLCGALVVTGLVGTSMALGRTVDLPDPLSLGVLSVMLASLSLRVGHDASDYVAAMARIVALTFAVMFLGGASALADQIAAPWGAAVPGGLLLRAVTGEPIETGLLALNALATLLATAWLLRSTVRAVEQDDPTLAPSAKVVLRRASGDWGPEVLLIALIAMTGEYFTSPLVGRATPLEAVTLKFFAFFLGPVLIAPSLFGLAPRPLLGLGAPVPRAWLALPLLVLGSLSAGFLALKGGMAVFPPPAEAVAQLAESLSGLAEGPGIVLVTLGAGVLEELLFRGLLMGLLLQRGKVWQAILLQALAFGLAHALGFRFAPTFAIGVFLGVLRWRTGSILPGMLVHTLHNAAAMRYGAELELDEASYPALLAGLGLGLVGLWLAGRRAPETAEPER